jgi:hypothetical protein
VQFTAIENWLEIEAAVARLFARRLPEWDTDILFRKPWTHSKNAEFMFCIGPEWVHAGKYGVTTNSVSAEAAPERFIRQQHMCVSMPAQQSYLFRELKHSV